MKQTFPSKPTREGWETQRIFELALADWYLKLEAHPHVQEVMHIPGDEPIFVLRSQDINAPETVDFWLGLSANIISSVKLDGVAKRYQEMLEWQAVKPDDERETRAKIPD